MKLRNKTFSGACAIALLLSSAGAISQVPADIKLTVTPKLVSGNPLQRAVNYGDLNLNRSQGVATLHRRIKSAAQYVCDPHSGRAPERRAIFLRCMDDSMSAAVVSVNNARLTAFHALKGGSAPILAGKVVR